MSIHDDAAGTCCPRFVRAISVEPIVFLLTLAFSLQMVVEQDLMISKVCRVNMNFSQEICANLSAHLPEQEEVQKGTADLNLYRSIASTVPSILSSLILGSWSDSGGRKPLLVLPIVGSVVAQIFNIGNVWLTGLRAEFLLLSSLSSLFGGFSCFLIGAYGYIADHSDQNTRTLRVALIDLFIFVGSPLGLYVSPYIFQQGGFYTIFCTAAALQCLAMIYTVFRIHEGQRPSAGRPISLKYLADVFRVSFKSRPDNIRPALILLLTAAVLNGCSFADNGTTYLFTRLRFSWTQKEYSVWASATQLYRAFFTILAVRIISVKLKMHDALIGVVGAAFGIAGAITVVFATSSWMMYISTAVSAMSYVPSVAIRSLVSKLIPGHDLGCVFSIVSCIESIVPLVAGLIFTELYTHTLDFFPEAIFLFTTIIYLMLAIVLSVTYVILRRAGFSYMVLYCSVDDQPPVESAVTDQAAEQQTALPAEPDALEGQPTSAGHGHHL